MYRPNDDTFVWPEHLAGNILPFRALDPSPQPMRCLQAECQKQKGRRDSHSQRGNVWERSCRLNAGLTCRLHCATGHKVWSILSSKHAALWGCCQSCQMRGSGEKVACQKQRNVKCMRGVGVGVSCDEVQTETKLRESMVTSRQKLLWERWRKSYTGL